MSGDLMRFVGLVLIFVSLGLAALLAVVWVGVLFLGKTFGLPLGFLASCFIAGIALRFAAGRFAP